MELRAAAHGRVINDLNLRLAVAAQQLMVEDCEPVALVIDHEHLEAPVPTLPATISAADRGRRPPRRIHA